MLNVKRAQAGFTLFEVILALGLTGVLSLMTLQTQLLEVEQRKAKITGLQLYQLNSAIAAWTAANAGSAGVTYTDTNWLKSSSCLGGTSAVAYLPCNFPKGDATEPLSGGKLTLSSVITTIGSAPNQVTTVTTTTTPYALAGGAKRADLAGLAAFVAAAGAKSFTPSMASSYREAKSSPSTAVITMVASNNPLTDVWLRTDGKNSMDSNLKFNTGVAPANREIQGVSRIANIASNTLTIGNPNGAASGYSVVFDAAKTNYGAVAIQNVQNLTYGLDLSSGQIQAQFGDISANGLSTIGSYAQATRLYDTDNTGYYLDPTNTSVFNAATFTSSLTTPALIDSQNTGFYMQPSTYTNLNQFTNLFTKVNGNVLVGGNFLVEGTWTQKAQNVWKTGCSPDGAISSNAAGEVLNCMGGVWNKLVGNAISSYQSYQSPTVAGLRQTAIGSHRLCGLGAMSNSQGTTESYCQIVTDGGGNWWINDWVQNSGATEHRCYATCFDN